MSANIAPQLRKLRALSGAVSRPMRALLCLLAALSVASCKRSGVISKPGYVIGNSNDITLFNERNASAKIRQVSDSVVLISTVLSGGVRKFCTGTVVGLDKNGPEAQELAITTNFHCFAVTGKSGEIGAEFMPEACKNTRVYFGFTKESATAVKEYHCLEGSLAGDNAGDIAILTIAEEFPETARALEIWEDPNIPADRDVLIIHHPDIEANFAEVGSTGVKLPAAAITERDCRTLGDFPTEEWPLDQSLPFSLKHTCDLVHGSSGSALIDRDTMKILGVNWGGIEIKYKKSKDIVNAATKGYYLLAFLNGELETIKESKERATASAEANQAHAEKKSKPKLGGCGSVGAFKNALSSLGFLLLLPLLVVVLSRPLS